MRAALLESMRSRNLVTGLAVPIVAAIAVGIAVVVVAGANNGISSPPPTTLSTGFPPARIASADFTDTAALAGRGTSGQLGQVAAFGSDLVAVGSQAGARTAHARFFFSADAGQTWKVGTVQANAAAAAPLGQAPSLVAGGPHGWVAVGPGAVWISPNGLSWLSKPPLPQLAGDRVTSLTATGKGFLAAGQNIPGGDAAKASPVVWLSANGTTWQRLGGTRLNLAAGTGKALGITAVAANGGVVVMAGTVAGATTAAQLWRSADGGMSWTAVPNSAGGGLGAAISGLAPLGGGFIAVLPAQVAGTSGATVYTSQDGATWQQSAQLKTADGAPLTLGMVSGGPAGAVVTGQAHGLDIAFISADGVTWTGTDPFGTTAGVQFTGVALTSAGRAVLVGASLAGTGQGKAQGQQPALTLIGAHGGPAQVNVRAIPGAAGTEVAVNAIAASAATQVAVGSADGFPALWVSGDGGSAWQRAAGTTPAALTRPGEEQLTGVAHGAAGWVAVGGGLGATPGPAVVVGSADGRTWAAADSGAAFTGPGQVVTAAVAAGRNGYVIVGHVTAGGRTVAAAWYAPGLTGWVRAADAQPGALDGQGNRQLDAVTATLKGFAAVGADGSRPAVWLSASGRTWSLVPLPLPGGAVRAELRYVAANGETVAAAGTEVTAAGRQLPFAAVSADGGATWTQTSLPVPPASAATAVTALAAAGGGFTATGTYGTPGGENVVVWMLARGAAAGTTWTAATPAGAGLAGSGMQAITGLTQTGSTLTGVGFIATAASEEPTIWQSPVRS
jgi:hypothetical protein